MRAPRHPGKFRAIQILEERGGNISDREVGGIVGADHKTIRRWREEKGLGREVRMGKDGIPRKLPKGRAFLHNLQKAADAFCEVLENAPLQKIDSDRERMVKTYLHDVSRAIVGFEQRLGENRK